MRLRHVTALLSSVLEKDAAVDNSKPELHGNLVTRFRITLRSFQLCATRLCCVGSRRFAAYHAHQKRRAIYWVEMTVLTCILIQTREQQKHHGAKGIIHTTHQESVLS